MTNIKYAAPVLLTLAGCATPSLEGYVRRNETPLMKKYQEGLKHKESREKPVGAVSLEDVVVPKVERPRVESQGYIVVEARSGTSRYKILEEDLRELKKAAAYDSKTGEGFDKENKKFTGKDDPNNDNHARSLDRLLSDADGSTGDARDPTGYITPEEVTEVLGGAKKEAYENADKLKYRVKKKIDLETKEIVEERGPIDPPKTKTSTDSGYEPKQETTKKPREVFTKLAKKPTVEVGDVEEYRFEQSAPQFEDLVKAIAYSRLGPRYLERVISIDHENKTCSAPRDFTLGFEGEKGREKFEGFLSRAKRTYERNNDAMIKRMDSLCRRRARADQRRGGN